MQGHKLTLQRPVAVAVVKIVVLRQQLPAGLDKQAGEILVQVVLELPLDRTVDSARMVPSASVTGASCATKR